MKNRIILPILSLLAVTSLGGCNSAQETSDVVINVTNKVSLKEGETYQINISVTGSEDIVLYKSDNTTVASVNDEGLVTALKEGKANITISVSNYQEVIEFTVSKKNTYLWYTIKDDVTDMSFLEGYPWLNTSIYGNIKKIEKPRIEDDYFANVNYDYFQTVTIPEGKERWGSVFEAQDVIDEHLEEIYTSSDSKVKTLLDLLDKGSKESIKEEIERILSLNDEQIMDMVLSKDSLLGISRLFSLIHVTGNEELRLNLPYSNADKGLNRRCIAAMYENTYTQMAEEIVTLANTIGVDIPNLKSRMQNMIYKVGHLYFDAYTKNGECKDITTVKDINETFNTSFDVNKILKSFEIDDEQKISYSEFTKNYAKAYETFTATDWKNYLLLKAIFDSRFFIGAEEYYSLLPSLEITNGEGKNESLTIEDMKKDIIYSQFYDVREREYINRFIPKSDRDKMLKIVKEVKDEFRIVLGEQDWLSDETKGQAQNKIDEMHYIAFYTDEYINHPAYIVSSNDIFNEFQSYNEYYTTGVAQMVIDNDSLGLWSNSVINAAYSPADNNFKIFHGIVAKGMNENISEAALYGHYGSTIGHEISHGFDSNGAKYDKDGFRNDWWTPEDKAKFEEKVSNIEYMYTNFLSGFRDLKFNGSKLTGEIIADMGGLKVISNLCKKKNMNLDEVFRGFAYSFAYVYTEESARNRVDTDAHPLSYLRVNMTAAQFDLFQQTYNLNEDDVMYIPTDARICIW